MADNRRFSGDYADDVERMHTPGGMTDPAASGRPSADGADMASTDMSQEPSSRSARLATVRVRGGRRPAGRACGARPIRRLEEPAGGSARPASPPRRRVRQLPEARRPRAHRAGRPRPGRAGRAGSSTSSTTWIGLSADGASRVRRAAPPGGRAGRQEAAGRSCRPRASSASTRSAQPFDPSLHEAVSTVPPPTPRAGPPGERHLPARLPVQGNAGSAGAGAGVLRAGTGLTWPPRTSTRSSAFPTRPARTRSRRPTAGWPSSTTPTPTRTIASAAERFKEISEAHSVLSDADKRKQYDQMRRLGAFDGDAARGPRPGRRAPRAPGRETWRPEGFDFGDFGGPGRHLLVHLRAAAAGRSRGPRRIETVVEVPFRVAALGGKVTVNLPVTEPARPAPASAARPAPPGPPAPSARAGARSPSGRAGSP